MPQTRIPCLLMRGGTSKGAFFLADDLPHEQALRDNVLLAVMGSPDPRQIDGLGGADPLTSKVAIIRPSARPDADVDYLFAQVNVDKAVVDYGQNCGNILAAVGPFAIERQLLSAVEGITPVRIFMENTGQIATAHVPVKEGQVCYQGELRIDGVPGTAAKISVEFADIAGSSCGALLPTGNARDTFDGIDVTCIDNGMPVILLRAADFGRSGYESREQLDADTELKKTPRIHPLTGGPENETRRCHAAHRAKNDIDCRTAKRWCHLQPDVYSASLPRLDWRTRRGQRRQRLPDPRQHHRRAGTYAVRQHAVNQRGTSGRRIQRGITTRSDKNRGRTAGWMCPVTYRKADF